jgi:hypothetical protein
MLPCEISRVLGGFRVLSEAAWRPVRILAIEAKTL